MSPNKGNSNHCPCGEKLDEILNRHVLARSHRVNFRELVTCFRYGERATHSIHPYPAKILPHIPHFFVSHPHLSPAGRTVGDPFGGSGTVALEAALAGRDAWVCDQNPLARLIATVKTCPIAPERIKNAHRRIEIGARNISKPSSPDVVNLEYWYYPHVIHGLAAVAEVVSAMRAPDLRAFFQVALSVTARRLSLADPRVPVPVRSSPNKFPKNHWLHSYHSQRLEFLRTADPLSEFGCAVKANAKRNRNLWEARNGLGAVQVIASDARELTRSSGRRMSRNTTDLIITSPPYGSAQKYTRSSSLSLGWLSLCESTKLTELDRLTIGREQYRKAEVQSLPETGISIADKQLEKYFGSFPHRCVALANYLIEMRRAISRTYEVISRGGHLVLIVGDNTLRGTHFRTSRFLNILCEDVGFRTRAILIDQIRSRGLLTRRNSTAGMIENEKIIVLRKDV